jgi:hypothetical protein
MDTAHMASAEETGNGHESTASDRSSKISRSTHDTIHFTVRVLLAEKYRSSRALDQFRTSKPSENSTAVYWARRGSNKSTSKMDSQSSIAEAEVTDEEKQLLDRWLKPSVEKGITSTYKTSTTSSRLTYKLLGLPPLQSLQSERRRGETGQEIFTDATSAQERLKDSKDRGHHALSFLLYAHLEESTKPTLMYNPDTATMAC